MEYYIENLGEVKENIKELSLKEVEEIFKKIMEIRKEIKNQYPTLTQNSATKKYFKTKKTCELCGTEHTLGSYYQHVKSKKHIANKKK